MKYDAAIARRMLRNSARRSAGPGGWAEARDLDGAIALTSEAPIAGLNCLRQFRTRDDRVELTLDIGFALLRAFDRDPAVELTPLDRPRSLAKRLRRRGLREAEAQAWLIFAGDAPSIAANPAVEVRLAEPEDARGFARVHGGGASWARKLSYRSTCEGLLDRRNRYYLGCIDGETAGTVHLLTEARTAGLYAVSTLRAFRGRGVATALLRQAIIDAQSARCDVVFLSAASAGKSKALYERLGFSTMFESELWTLPAP